MTADLRFLPFQSIDSQECYFLLCCFPIDNKDFFLLKRMLTNIILSHNKQEENGLCEGGPALNLQKRLLCFGRRKTRQLLHCANTHLCLFESISLYWRVFLLVFFHPAGFVIPHIWLSQKSRIFTYLFFHSERDRLVEACFNHYHPLSRLPLTLYFVPHQLFR